jgi:dihydrodipicolinate synthase/N-acetylneuraminate lyase
MIEASPIYAERGQADPASDPATPRYRYQPRRGLSIPAITVLDPNGRVIEEEQRRVFRYLAQQGRGADILFGVGTTGEWNRISNSERQRLIWIETDEVARINQGISQLELQPVEAWVGVTATTRSDTLANIECAIEARADAAVIAHRIFLSTRSQRSLRSSRKLAPDLSIR